MLCKTDQPLLTYGRAVRGLKQTVDIDSGFEQFFLEDFAVPVVSHYTKTVSLCP